MIYIYILYHIWFIVVLRRTHFSIHRNRRLDRGSPVWLSSSLSMSSSPDSQSCDGEAVSATCCNKALAAKWLWKIFMIWYEIWYDHNDLIWLSKWYWLWSKWSDVICIFWKNLRQRDLWNRFQQNDTWSARWTRRKATMTPLQSAQTRRPHGPFRRSHEAISTYINIYQQYEVCYLEHLTVLQHAQISLLLKSMFIWFSHPQIIWFWYFDFSLGDLKVASIVLLGRVDPGWNLSQAGWGLTWLDWNSALHSMRRAFCDAVWGHNMP